MIGKTAGGTLLVGLQNIKSFTGSKIFQTIYLSLETFLQGLIPKIPDILQLCGGVQKNGGGRC